MKWSDVRALDGSQAKGFEELCSQLARLEVPSGAEFFRKGTPDAGVECFCVFEDGQREWGWQSKFCLTALDDSRWNQLDRSVRTALDAHPSLVRYYVCVPRDRSDGRRRGITTEKQKWEDRVAKWEGWARERGMAVEFMWWGASELRHRLSLPGQAGRYWFWFEGTRHLSEEWFAKHHRRSVDAAGPRYTSEVHVDVPLVKDFELFGRSEPAVAAVRRLAKEIKQRPLWRLVGRVGEDASDNMLERRVDESVSEVVRALSEMRCPPNERWKLSNVSFLVDAALQHLKECKAALAFPTNGSGTHGAEESVEIGGETTPNREAAFQAEALERVLWSTKRKVRQLERVVNADLMLVTGDAGVGKTHLLCDMGSKRLGDNQPTVILMGQQFTTTEHPWTQASAQLDLGDLTMEQFVGALEAAAQAANCRALLMVDAINEGEGYDIWPDYLADFLSQLSESPWIGVVLSVRTTYIDHIVPPAVRESAHEVKHKGFADDTYAAVRRFCEHYGVSFPTTPLLRPEFDNPLFLITLCKGLQHTGQKTIPGGSEGISRVFGRYLVKIDMDLARRLDYDPDGAVVVKALDAVAAELSRRGSRWLPRGRAQELVNAFWPASGFSRSLYRALVDSGLLMEIPGSNSRSGRTVHFGFERLADHLIAGHLIDSYGDARALATALIRENAASYEGAWRPWNIPLEALSILLPERLGIELPDVLVNSAWADYAWRGFVEGLPWRDPTKIGPVCRALVEDLMAGADYWDIEYIFDALMTCALVPDHPLGSGFLDQYLRGIEMPDRDAVWSRYLHGAYSNSGPVNRLLDWVQNHLEPTALLDRDTAEACVTVLAWFLTASHRFVRDRATKGLVTVLRDDVGLTCELVRRFHDVDDPYVCERVMAVAYGVAMRTNDARAVAPLADLVYRLVFADGDPPVHILLRDYARGIIERAQHVGARITFDATLADPPYHSHWPHIPDATELEQFDLLAMDHQRELTDAERGQVRIYSSVMNWDFARYIIGTNATSESRRWLSVPNTDPLWQSAEELALAFRCSLAPPVRSMFDELWGGTRTVESPFYMMLVGSGIELESPDTGKLLIPPTIKEQYLDPVLEEQFIAILNGDQKTTYQEIKTARDTKEPRLSLDIIQRYVLWRVFDLGWTTDRFGDLDSRIARGPTRTTHKPERIGKKYQWIAYHEILARISDRYQYRVSYDDVGPPNAYRGTWQLSVRDIDPSALLVGAPSDRRASNGFDKWWSRETPIPSTQDVEHERWLRRESDIPDYKQQLRFTRPQDGSTWVKLYGHDTWQSPTPPDRDFYEADRREVWLDVCGYLINANAVDKFIAWSKTVTFWNRWMPEPPTPLSLFFGELGWSFAFKALVSESLEPQQPAPQEGAPYPTPLRATAVGYTAEGRGYDCSIVEGYNLHRPSPQLAKALDLSWTGRGADFVDSEGALAAFDPSAHDPTSSTALFIREDSLQQFLKETESALVWRVIGEKRAFGPGRWEEAWVGFLQLTGASTYTPDGPQGYLTPKLEIHNPK